MLSIVWSTNSSLTSITGSAGRQAGRQAGLYQRRERRMREEIESKRSETEIGLEIGGH
jgi:hypothetical protein